MENLQQSIMELRDSLKREIAGLRQEMRAGFAAVNARFDEQIARLDSGDSPQ